MHVVYFAQEETRSEHEPIAYSKARGRRTSFVFNRLGEPATAGLIKIGWTASDPSYRLRKLGTSIKRWMSLLGCIEGGQPEEFALHKRFTHLRAATSWGTEWFVPDRELTEFIASLPLPRPELGAFSFDGVRHRMLSHSRLNRCAIRASDRPST